MSLPKLHIQHDSAIVTQKALMSLRARDFFVPVLSMEQAIAWTAVVLALITLVVRWMSVKGSSPTHGGKPVPSPPGHWLLGGWGL